MRHLFLRQWPIFFLLLGYACHVQDGQHGSESKGLGSAVIIRTPKPKTAAELVGFRTAMQRTAVAKMSPGGTLYGRPRETLRQVLLRSLVETDGMPREQVTDVMVALARDDKGCGGASCSRVFDVRPQDVPGFLDDSVNVLKNSEHFARPANVAAREILLSSLQKTQDLWRPADTGAEPVFADIASAKVYLSAVITENRPKLARMIREQRYQINMNLSDDELFLSKNCGPASIALQKILADRGIYAEARVNSRETMDHEYLLYRAPLADGTTVDVVVDPTYRQFLFNYTNRQMFKNFRGGTIDDQTVRDKIKAYGLDEVLIVEWAELDRTLASLSSKLPEFDAGAEMRFAYEKGAVDSSQQREHREYLTEAQITRLRKGRPSL